MTGTSSDTNSANSDREAEREAAIQAQQYTEDTIAQVGRDEERNAWFIDLAGGTGFGASVEQFLDEPKVGDLCRLYTDGGQVVGVDLNGKMQWFHTAAELQAAHEKWVAERQVEQKRRFEADKESLDEAFSHLPLAFRRRIQLFRNVNPDFRWEFESYEMFVCTQAMVLADHLLNTVDGNVQELDIEKWFSTEGDSHPRWPDEVEAFYSEEHSGNTYGFSVAMAHNFLLDLQEQRPPLSSRVFRAHGALSPLVGCDAYGCPHPRPGQIEEPQPTS